MPNGQPLPVVLVANKCDIDDAEVDQDALDRYIEQHNFVGWFETSAMLNLNIDKAARFLVTAILRHADIFEARREAVAPSNVRLDETSTSSGKCC